MDNQNNDNLQTVQTSVPMSQLDMQPNTLQSAEQYMQNGGPMPQANESIKESNVDNSIDQVDTLMQPSSISMPMPQTSNDTDDKNMNSQTNMNQMGASEKTNHVTDNRIYFSNNSTSGPHSLMEAINSGELISAYVGPSYDSILRRVFNFSAFFFTFIYYFYRRMISIGLLIAIIESALAYFFSDKLYILLIVNLFCGFLTNRIYISFVAGKINKIIRNNPSRNAIEIKGMCYALGGTSVRNIVVAFIWTLLALLPVGLIMCYLGLATKLLVYIQSLNLNIEIPDIKISDLIKVKTNNNGIFEGEFEVNRTTKINDEFNITIPKNFKKELISDDYEYNYNYKSNMNHLGTCSFSFKAVNGFTSAENLINQIHDYYKALKPSDIKQENANSIKWHTFSYKTSEANVYYKVCEKEDKIYVYYYEDQVDSSNICHTDLDNIFFSISYK